MIRVLAFTALVAGALPMAGCTENPTELRPPELDGRWSYSVSGLAGEDLVCAASGKVLAIARSGGTLTGRSELSGSARMECSPTGGATSIRTPQMGGWMDLHGSVSGDRFTIEEISETSSGGEVFYWRSEGTLSGDVITGMVTVRDYGESGMRTLTGQFRAVRQQ